MGSDGENFIRVGVYVAGGGIDRRDALSAHLRDGQSIMCNYVMIRHESITQLLLPATGNVITNRVPIG